VSHFQFLILPTDKTSNYPPMPLISKKTIPPIAGQPTVPHHEVVVTHASPCDFFLHRAPASPPPPLNLPSNLASSAPGSSRRDKCLTFQNNASRLRKSKTTYLWTSGSYPGRPSRHLGSCKHFCALQITLLQFAISRSLLFYRL
jgi:hypothetical protein